MDFRILLFILVFLGSTSSRAQSTDFDSLKSAIENAASPEEKAKNMNVLAEKLILSGHLADASYYVGEALKSSRKQKDTEQIARALDNRGQILLGKFDYSNAMQSFLEALQAKERLKDGRGAAHTRYLIGKTLLAQGDYDNAQPKLTEALEQYRTFGNKSGEVRAQKSLGDLALSKKILGEARQRYESATEAAISNGDLVEAANLSNQLGEVAIQMGDWEGALVYYRQSFDLHSSTNDMKNMATDYLNIGQALTHQGEKEEAASAYETAFELSKEVQDTFGMARAQAGFGLAFASTTPQKSAAAFQYCMALLKPLQAQPGMAQIYANAADFFKKQGNMGEAYTALSAHLSTKEALYSLEKNKEMLDLATRYESQIAEEKNRQTIEQLELQESKSSLMRWGLLGMLGFAFLALWALWNKNRLEKRDNELLQMKNNEIDGKNKELGEKNNKLDDLNSKLVVEIAEREMIERASLDKDKHILSLSRNMQIPLKKIQHIARALNDANSVEEKNKALQDLQFRANDLLVLINDLLEKNQIDAGKLNSDPTEFNPAEVLNQINEQYSIMFQHRNVPFSIEYDTSIPASLYGDPVRLSQILGNLLNHAIEKSIPQTANLRVFCAAENNDTSTLQAEITATYEKEEATKLFHSDQAGINIAKRLTDIQNGRFETLCQSPEQLCYSIMLPYRKRKPLKNNIAINELKAKEVISGKQILLVEDNKINQMVVAKLLEKQGAKVQVAENGLDALERIAEKNPFDLILMDIQMPLLDGYRTTAEIRKMENKSKAQMPIIALTASAYLTDKDKARLFQMEDHIGKPFSPEELLEKVMEVFEQESK